MLPHLFCVAVFYMSQVSVCVWSGRESVTIDTQTISGKGERESVTVLQRLFLVFCLYINHLKMK